MALGKFSIAPRSEHTGDGMYRASVTVSRGRGQGSQARITRFHRPFATPEAARLVALTHGWLQTFDVCAPAH